MTSISATGRRRRSLIPQKYLVAYLFISVPVFLFIVFLVIPMCVSLWWSFTDYNGIKPANFIGLKNYIDLFTKDRFFPIALKNTTLFVLMGMSLGPTLGLLTALLLNQKVRFQSLFRTAYFLPVMTSMVVVSVIWVMLYNDKGIINIILLNLGITPPKPGWLSSPNIALISVVIASVWQGFGFETVVFLAALQSIPKEQYEAATIDGAGPVARFWYVTVPHLRPVLLYVYIIGIIGSYQVFDQVFVMTGGGPVNATLTLVYRLYYRFQNHYLGEASAIAYVLFIILLIFSYLQWRFVGGRE
jgi:ABC-type sugar transport system permease subunit